MKPIYKRFIAYAKLLFLLLYWITSEVFYARCKRPDGISNVGDFYRVFGPPTAVREFERDGATFHHLYGHYPFPPWLAFPSDVPAYVFDASGHFQEWSSDIGDDTRYQQRWLLRDGRSVDPKEFQRRYVPRANAE